MHENWLGHLRSSGARIDGADILGFGDRDRIRDEPALAISGSIAAPIIDRGTVRASGPDAERFLQAQFTNDLSLATPDRSQLNAYCTPQGRMVASFRLLRSEDGFLLCAPRGVLGSLVEKLIYFRLRAQVTFEDASAELLHIGLSGPATEKALARAGLSLPHKPNAATVHDPIHIVRIPGDRVRVEILAPAPEMPALWDVLTSEDVKPVGPSAWTLLDVRAGLPWVYEATAQAFVPQMLNLHALEGVSFTKGCYPGQEIVARLRYRGTLKRRMYRLRTASAERPAPGDPVMSGGENAIGKVVMAAPSPEEGQELLAVLVIEEAERGDAELTLASGETVFIDTLPYDVEMALDRDG